MRRTILLFVGLLVVGTGLYVAAVRVQVGRTARMVESERDAAAAADGTRVVVPASMTPLPSSTDLTPTTERTATVTPELTPLSRPDSAWAPTGLPAVGPACPTDLADSMMQIDYATAPWFNSVRGADCVAEVRLAAVYPERYNTADGRAPVGEVPESYAWQTYLPLRFDVERILRCDRPARGFLVLQQRQLWPYPDPTPELRVTNKARWLVRPDTMFERPLGLAVTDFREPLTPEPPEDYYMYAADAYMHALARSLSTHGDLYLVADPVSWDEYVGDEALACGWKSESRRPIAELLCEVNAALALKEPRWDEPAPACSTP
jgi:hypothetical protein